MSDLDAEKACSPRSAGRKPNGEPVCPHCGGLKPHEDAAVRTARSASVAGAAKADFSLTSGTLFAFHKLPLRCYLAAIAIFCNEVKGKSALALSRDLGVSIQDALSSWLHKIREAVASEMKGAHVGGEGKSRGGRWRLFRRLREAREPCREPSRSSARRQSKRQASRLWSQSASATGARSLRFSGPKRPQSSFIKSRVAKGTELMADEANSWNELHASYAMLRINHQQAYSENGACTNGAEEFFSRMRRAEVGHHHHIATSILPATLPSRHGATIIAASTMAGSSARLRLSLPRTSQASISAATGRGRRRVRPIRLAPSAHGLIPQKITEENYGDCFRR
jgi:sarcosine oxidase delta subunit